jgi:hypothetical protein
MPDTDGLEEVAAAAVDACGYDRDNAAAVVTVVRLTDSGDHNAARTWAGPGATPTDALLTADAAALRRHADLCGMTPGRYWNEVGALVRETVELEATDPDEP